MRVVKYVLLLFVLISNVGFSNISYGSIKEQKGIASYYGSEFHGRKTASGERFNMYKLTAAHKFLPLNTYIKVTNISNGKSIIARISDRGPFIKGRIIDLTKEGAKQLDFLKKGTALVKIEVLEKNGIQND